MSARWRLYLPRISVGLDSVKVASNGITWISVNIPLSGQSHQSYFCALCPLLAVSHKTQITTNEGINK
jgi:hypothetical protein